MRKDRIVVKIIGQMSYRDVCAAVFGSDDVAQCSFDPNLPKHDHVRFVIGILQSNLSRGPCLFPTRRRQRKFECPNRFTS